MFSSPLKHFTLNPLFIHNTFTLGVLNYEVSLRSCPGKLTEACLHQTAPLTTTQHWLTLVRGTVAKQPWPKTRQPTQGWRKALGLHTFIQLSRQARLHFKEAAHRGKLASVDSVHPWCEGRLENVRIHTIFGKDKTKMDARAINLFVGTPWGRLYYRWWAKGTEAPAFVFPVLQRATRKHFYEWLLPSPQNGKSTCWCRNMSMTTRLY